MGAKLPVKPRRGTRANLPASAPSGELLVTTDTGEFFLGTGAGLIKLVETKVGTIRMSAVAEADWGELLCDGSAVSRTTYSRLFAKIGTTYGAGDGSTTFNLPAQAAKFPMGNTPGATGGSNTDDISHSHAAGTLVTGNNTGTQAVLGAVGPPPSCAPAPHTHSITGSTDTSGQTAHDNRPAFTGYAFYIYAGQ